MGGTQTLFMANLLRFASADLAIDLGTANTVVYLRDYGVVLAEPSVVAIETNNGIQKVRAVGDEPAIHRLLPVGPNHFAAVET